MQNKEGRGVSRPPRARVSINTLETCRGEKIIHDRRGYLCRQIALKREREREEGREGKRKREVNDARYFIHDRGKAIREIGDTDRELHPA
jgi:hypothetical protein